MTTDLIVGRQLEQVAALVRTLETAHDAETILEIETKLDVIERYMRDAGLFTIDHIRPVNEARMLARWKLGRALADVERTQGARSDKATSSTGLTKLLGRLHLTKQTAMLAQRVAAMPDTDLRKALAEAAQHHRLLTFAELIQRAKPYWTRERRTSRERELATKITALPDARFGVIVADPEWRWEPWSRLTGMDRAADNHYPTSCLEVIKARDVPSIAAKDCVLFLWATGPMNPHALLVMAAWGFDYKAQYVWGKDKFGTGYWNREKHELLLIGTRGNVPCPAPGTQWQSLIMAPRGRHSEKPECFLEMIEAYFPNVPKIELNRRGPPRPGWDAWGLEVEAAEAAE